MIYLNNAATSYPKPPCVVEAVQRCLNSEPASQFRSGAQIQEKEITQRCKEQLADLFGISESERIWFTSGATEAWNTLLCGVAKTEKEGAILVTQTEHNSVLRPVLNQEAMRGFRMVVVPCEADGFVTQEALEKSLTEDTKILVVNHCSNVTGRVQNMEQIGIFARRHKLLFFADVSQSAGALPIQADAWGLNGLVFTGHKSLFGMQGIGGFYLCPGLNIPPLLYGGTGRNSERLTYEDDIYDYEVGTQNLPGITSLNAGVDYILQIGLDAIEEKEHKLMQILYTELSEIPEIVLYGNPKADTGPILSLNFKGLTAADAGYILHAAYDITVRTGLHCSPLIHDALGSQNGGTVRVSISYLTSQDEVYAFIAAAKEIAKGLSM